MTRFSLSMNKLSLKKWKSEIIKTVLIIIRHVYSKNQIVSIIDMQKSVNTHTLLDQTKWKIHKPVILWRKRAKRSHSIALRDVL